MVIRDARERDVPVIRLVAERAWSTDYPNIISRETVAEGVHQWYDEAAIEEALHRNDAMVLVATADDDVAGFIHVVYGDDIGNILRLYVDPGYRGTQLGSDLLEAATERLFETGVDEVRGMVLAANEPGNEFYRKHGFEPTGDTHETEIGGEYHDERVWVRTRDHEGSDAERTATASP